MRTLTGGFSIGLRRLKSPWQEDLDETLSWARDNGFEAIDLLADGDKLASQVVAAGFRLGSVDLPGWRGMLSPDRQKRQEAIDQNAEYIKACAASGPVNHFVVMLPENPELEPAENFGYMVESYGELTGALKASRARIVIEGWPGPGALCCTPESLRAFFKECPSDALGFNYDPSHLIRMGIDHLRFLDEFVGRVYHAHAKDTELLDEGLYEYGNHLPSVFAKPVRYGGTFWRYTLPGHGVTRWTKVFEVLSEAGYEGCVSVELEDARFYGDPEKEATGFIQACRYLQGC